MNILSLFDGMSCGQLALDRAGIKYKNYFSSEIDKYAIKVAMKNYPNTIQLGDVTKIDFNNLPKIDLLIGGSPCQGFSFAGKQLNFDDPRSKLFFEYVKAKNTLKPKYFMLENVLMKKEYQDVISKELGVEPIRINSALVSAQKRDRLYWANIPLDRNLMDKGLLFKDILDKEVTKPSSSILQSRFRLTHKDDGSRLVIGTTAIMGKIGQRDRVYGVNNKIPTLTATDYKQPKQVYVDGLLRRLTTLECERLQTVPDNYTEGVSNSQRYKMLGNGWTVDVIAHIFGGIKHELPNQSQVSLL